MKHQYLEGPLSLPLPNYQSTNADDVKCVEYQTELRRNSNSVDRWKVETETCDRKNIPDGTW